MDAGQEAAPEAWEVALPVSWPATMSLAGSPVAAYRPELPCVLQVTGSWQILLLAHNRPPKLAVSPHKP